MPLKPPQGGKPVFLAQTIVSFILLVLAPQKSFHWVYWTLLIALVIWAILSIHLFLLYLAYLNQHPHSAVFVAVPVVVYSFLVVYQNIEASTAGFCYPFFLSVGQVGLVIFDKQHSAWSREEMNCDVETGLPFQERRVWRV
ncbi:hypothetical protein Cob_v000080 [Colletotrichum orbiculare MAFF 240422]|uniref:Uncharacterized protein n=1 Tax=Colletotrichum orbiculare (strain 104-T / ATCC 96160 / CBS 514.97 / LARS 414 / MAFF 240422) TaxID=1213857 RepID=A0A484G895_COLOR|nr:hypothetical protein Cob_v000080 [Colletotrichum orbiculare MAFF 240422]